MANNWTRLMACDFDGVLSVPKDPASTLPPSALSMLYRSVLASCDGIDGVLDGVIDDPRRCTFDHASLSCSRPHDGSACLTEPQVEAARRIYRGLKDPVSGSSCVRSSHHRERKERARP
jgi:feruloyl esterase